MALIDLSRFTTNISTSNPTKEYFSSNGASAYEALSKLGQNVSNTAMDMYARQMDIFTDKEKSDAINKFNLSLAETQAWALSNIDENTDKVAGTDQTYEEYIASFIDNNKNIIRDSLTEQMSKTKFDFAFGPLETEEKAKAVFKSSSITVENTIKRGDKKRSENSNEILYSDSLSVLDNLNQKIAEYNNDYSTIEKTVGLKVAQVERDKTLKSYMESSVEASLRIMSTDPAGMYDFSLILGPGLMFKDFGEYKKYVMQQYLDLGATKDEAEEMVNKESYLLVNDQNATLAKGHPNSNLLSPEYKKDALNRALAIMFKNKKKKDGDLAEQKNDWIKWASVKQPVSGKLLNMDDPGTRKAIALRGAVIYQDEAESQVVRDVYKMVNERIKFEAAENRLGKGAYAYTNNPKEIKAKRDMWANDIISQMLPDVSPQELAKRYPEIGSSSLNDLQESLRTQQRNINYDRNTQPLKFKYEDPGFTARLSKAFRNTPNGIVVDKNMVNAISAELDNHYKNVGTLASGIERGNILSDRNLGGMLDKLETMPTDAKIQFYKDLNTVDPKVAGAFYSQAIRENKMDIADQFVVGNLQIGDPATADFYTKKFLDMENKYTQKYINDLIGTFKKSVNWWTPNKDFNDLSKAVSKAAGDSKYLNSLKEAARATGRSEEQIKAMFSEKFLAKLTLDYMSRNSPDNSVTGYWSFNSMVEDSFNKVLKDTYEKRAMPINSDALKAVVDPKDVSNVDAVTDKAKALGDRIKQALQDGTLRLDPTHYEGMSKMKEYEKLSPQKKYAFFERDVMSGVFFKDNLTLAQDYGKQKELYVRFKDKKTGAYHNLKLVGPDGKSRVLYLNNMSELDRLNVDEAFNSITKDLTHSKIKGK